MSQQPNAPPSYDDAQKYSMYPDPNAPPRQGYQPAMDNPQHGGPPMPPPTHGAPPPQQPHGTGNNTTYVYASPQWGPRPQNAFCPNCNQQVLTKVKYAAGLLTWLLFGGCLLFGCWLGCCLIPFCVDDCNDCEHYCTNCKAFLGQYKRI